MKLDWVTQIPQLHTPKIYAQFGEEAIFDHIFSNIGTKENFVVDFGAGTLNSGLSNSRYLIEKGWNGLLMDGNPSEKNEIIKQEFITAENIVSLFDKYNVPKEFDLLSIDVDGNDFWILKSIMESEYSPRVIINEFNGCILEGEEKIMVYNPNHSWGENDYYGASFQSFKSLLRGNNELGIKGYTLVHQIATTNMIFIREDIVPQFNYGISYVRNQYHAHSPNREWTNTWMFNTHND
jgi:hypothetical protein